jgi:hypothetical protein
MSEATIRAETLATARKRVEAHCLRPIADIHGRPTWICQECSVVGAHLADCRLAAILAVLAPQATE